MELVALAFAVVGALSVAAHAAGPEDAQEHTAVSGCAADGHAPRGRTCLLSPQVIVECELGAGSACLANRRAAETLMRTFLTESAPKSAMSHADKGTPSIAPSVAPTTELERRQDSSVLRQSGNDRGDTSEVRGRGSTFVVKFNDGFPSAARVSFEAAVRSWAELWESRIELRVRALWGALPRGTLGATASQPVVAGDDDAPLHNDTSYTVAMATSLTGRRYVRDAEIIIQFNSELPWSFAERESDVRRDQYDLQTVALHELGHGLFFDGQLRVESLFGVRVGMFGDGGIPARFDDFVSAPAGGGVVMSCGAFGNDSNLLAQALVTEGLFFFAPQAPRGSGGGNFTLFAPSRFTPGSSVYHLAESSSVVQADCANAGIPATECSDLMTPGLPNGYVQRAVGENTIRVARAMLSSVEGAGVGSCEQLSPPPRGGRVPGVPQDSERIWLLVAAAVGAFLLLAAGITVVANLTRRWREAEAPEARGAP